MDLTLAHFLTVHRGCGRVHCRLQETKVTGGDANVIERFLVSEGFAHPAVSLLQIDRTQAREHIVSLFTADQAHSMPAMPPADAEFYADRFLSMFSDDPRLFTNSGRFKTGRNEWSPITEATFDSGVICLCDALVGMIWFEDED